MYWLMLLAGIASPVVASAQSQPQPRFPAAEPDYAQGYERRDSPPADQPWLAPEPVPLFDADTPRWSPEFESWKNSAPANTTPPAYRFRGDPPPTAAGTWPADPDSEPRFRPLTPRERERLGPTLRWRPADADRHDRLPDVPERSTLFDALVPQAAPPPDPRGWPH